jgi:hypothetical protein
LTGKGTGKLALRWAASIQVICASTNIESLLMALGAECDEGSGSRVRFALNGIRATFQRPHPQKETDRGAVKSVRRFLEDWGIRP